MSLLTVPPSEKDHILGSLDAPITLVEYGDYECPYCGEAFWQIKKLLDIKKDDIAFIFRNFPLTQIHSHARHAAQAAEAADRQNRFWKMHDILYENQSYLTDEDLFDYANELELNLAKFKRDFQSPGVVRRIEEDFESGVFSGVNGTPTFFINGERYNGSYDVESLLNAIDTI